MYYENLVNRKELKKLFEKRIKEKYGSIAEYARQTGQDYKTVHSWMSRNKLPNLDDLVALCNHLNIPLEYALGKHRKLSSKEMNEEKNVFEDNVENTEFINEHKLKVYNYRPNLLFTDIALITPLIGFVNINDIMSRAIDSNDSNYIYNLFRNHIKTDTNPWKYVVYTLQQRYSPLVDGIEIIKEVLWSSFFVTLRPNSCRRVYETP